MTALRSALFYVWLLLATLALGLVSFAIRAFARQHALWLGQVWAAAVLAGLRVLCGVCWTVTGREHLPPDGPMLIASQHQSAFDTLVWMTLLPRVSYVYKSELARIPIVGPMLLASGQTPVRRQARGAAIQGLLLEAERAVADRRQIIIFPQGTRTAPGTDVRLRTGIVALAHHTGLPVVPVATDSGHVWRRRAFRKRSGVVHLVVCPALAPDLSSSELLSAIATSWRDAERAMEPVDNSVRNVPMRTEAAR